MIDENKVDYIEGWESYSEMGQKLLNRNLTPLNGREIAQLFWQGMNHKNGTSRKILNKFLRGGKQLWVYGKNIWTPKGVYTVDDPQAEGVDAKVDLSKLEKKVREGGNVCGIRVSCGEGAIRFAPRPTFLLFQGNQSINHLIRDGVEIAKYSPEGVDSMSVLSFTRTSVIPRVLNLDSSYWINDWKSKGRKYIQTVSTIEQFPYRENETELHFDNMSLGYEGSPSIAIGIAK